MKRITLTFGIVLSIATQALFAQINTPSNAAKPFGSGNYAHGLMPTNLPSGGKYGASQIAADVYNNWKKVYVANCENGLKRVIFDDNTSTVSEGIAYGMLLSVYAADKDLFDGLWAYYKAHVNTNGVMNWKMADCEKTIGTGGATDAELDAAMALIVAAQQWAQPNYKAEAIALIQIIKKHEMTAEGQTINGDQWGMENPCRNPSYFSPAYYSEYAKIDTANAEFWNTTAINASNAVLLANAHKTTGLVSNWADNQGNETACGHTGGGADGYGADACRNPWRMAVDYLWHGNEASAAAKIINAKLAAYVGNGSDMRAPIKDRSSSISTGIHRTKTYTMFALPSMAAGSQANVNSCYENTANFKIDSGNYFARTIHAITLFVMTGNFWQPNLAE